MIRGTNFGELRYGEVRRIPLPRTRANEGIRKGRDLWRIGPNPTRTYAVIAQLIR